MNKQTVLWILRLLVGGLFIFSGLIKVNDPVGTAIKLEEYFDVFSNDIAGFFYYFKPFALYIGVVLVVAEVVLGVMLIIGVKLKKTVWALGLMVLFFTFLTFYSAYFNKVTDCGCFGDAIKLTPWESFYKDIILLIMISFLFFYRKDLPEETPKWASITAIFTLVISLAIAYWAIQNLPFIDFRAYKNGVNIPVNMQPSSQLQYIYVMKKDGETFTFDQYPAEDGYEFVEMVLQNPDALPKISDFAAWNAEGDQSEFLFAGNKVIILSSNMAKMSEANLDKLNDLVKSMEGAPVDVVFMAAASQEEIDSFLSKQNWSVMGLQADATVVKTIMRANPGIMILKDGVVMEKYHHNNTPDATDVLDFFL
ncbi:DoxX protein [Algoriphagus alkaliphilus]|uniref:DoxX protein n=1 Tax=Algoriphagus alkaliphilus TaxID=279824 RepID=A0A1G5WWW2_9BACT|nr:BT_3928 family protein [Algoriphagus alkaliphilus]MBA4301817.1 DoxX family membrane protein [Cyclobacterium sp.]SDA62502.1 DoxX protein [Algoriphagus alkaliphilus]